jgi:hypothetical protein
LQLPNLIFHQQLNKETLSRELNISKYNIFFKAILHFIINSTCLIFIKTEISQSTQKDKLLFANHYTEKHKD